MNLDGSQFSPFSDSLRGGNIMTYEGIALAACMMAVGVCNAQQVTPAPAVVPAAIIPEQPVSTSVLRAGTKVPLKMAEQLTTKGKKLRVGQRFQLEVAEDIRLNDLTVIPAGTPAIGEVTDVRNKGMWGKSGRIGAQLLYLRVNGRQVRLTGSFDDKGVTGTAGVVAAIAFVPIAGFFTTGTSATLPLGGAVSGFLDEDVPVQMNGVSAPAPIIVTAPQASPPVAPVVTPVSATAAVPVPTPAKVD
ncbi:hypothetical protein [Sphingomonas koreensis]